MLRLYNTMGREMQDFVPITSGFVGFYGCGPTVYNYAHIGNLRAYIFLDILDRTLTFLGFKKKHVMNITDVGHLTGDDDSGEDKMQKSADARKMTVLEVADFYTKAFLHDIDALNIVRPDVICKATEHIDDMIALIKRIEANGHTYMAAGNLYFDVSTFPDYGKLAQLDISALKAGARIAVDPNKRNPCDFVLWFTKSKFDNHALQWDSPWGRGYPGWHIECSAMSIKYLGEHFDIHTGGIDHIPIHHTNEIAQSEGATNHKWVNYWLHNEFLVVGKDGDKKSAADAGGANGGDSGAATKMSKSEGNFLRLQTLVDAGYDPLDYRYFLLTAHYRKQVFFSYKALDSAKNSRASLVAKVAKLLKGAPHFLEKTYAVGEACHSNDAAVQKHIDEFTSALENDLSTPLALGALSKVFRDKALDAASMLDLVARFDGVLGLKLIEGARSALQKEAQAVVVTMQGGDAFKGCADFSDEENATIRDLIEKRAAARKSKDFATSDAIRDKLNAMGVQIIDTPTGVQWKRQG